MKNYVIPMDGLQIKIIADALNACECPQGESEARRYRALKELFNRRPKKPTYNIISMSIVSPGRSPRLEHIVYVLGGCETAIIRLATRAAEYK